MLTAARGLSRVRPRLAWTALPFTLVALWAIVPDPLWAAQATAVDGGPDVREFFGISPRSVIWVVAQLHLLFAAFVVGVPWFAVTIEFVGWRTGDPKYDRLAREFTGLLAAAFATTAAFGGLLTFALIGLYPRFSSFFFGIFAPAFYIYGLVFLVETALLYLYYFSWDRLRHRKPLHLGIGVLFILSGTVIVFMASSWTSYMMSPTAIDETGAFTGSVWEATNNPLWIPISVHRLLGNLTFGGFVVAAYAAIRFLAARSEPDRAHYDWMGYVGNFVAFVGLIPLPFAGYYLGKEVYDFSPVMGNNMMGGDFSWAFIVQAMLLGLIFIGGNFYLWSGMERIPGAERYRSYIKYYVVVLAVCVAIWMTPRNLPLRPEEELILGGQLHPLLGYFGLMSAKNAVINLVILTTFLSFMLYRRANKSDPLPVSRQGWVAWFVIGGGAVLALAIQGWYALRMFQQSPLELGLAAEKVSYLRFLGGLLLTVMAVTVAAAVLALRDRAKLAQGIVFATAVIACVPVLGGFGFVVMTDASPLLRHGAVTQWLVLMTALVVMVAIDLVLYRGARSMGGIRWGRVTARSQYALVGLCVLILMTMGMMAYVRSGLREDWHIYGVMRDTSRWAYTPDIGEMSMMAGGITLVFLAMIAFLFWLSTLGRSAAHGD